MRQLVEAPLPNMTCIVCNGNVPGDLAAQTVFLDSVVAFLHSHTSCTISAKDMNLKYIVDDDLKKRLSL